MYRRFKYLTDSQLASEQAATRRLMRKPGMSVEEAFALMELYRDYQAEQVLRTWDAIEQSRPLQGRLFSTDPFSISNPRIARGLF